MRLGRLHVITDTSLQSRFSHAELAELAIKGGADTIQFRQKTGPIREIIRQAQEVREVTAAHGIPLIVNDRLDVALACRADGLHLGQSDMPMELARDILGKEFIIGGSANSKEEIKFCLRAEVDYIGIGPVFPTGSKDDASPALGLDGFKAIAGELYTPVVAIGGVTSENIPALYEAGTFGVAVISAVCCQPDPAAAAKALWDVIGN